MDTADLSVGTAKEYAAATFLKCSLPAGSSRWALLSQGGTCSFEPIRTQRDWALAYLRARGAAYQRRTLTARNIVGAVHMALKRNVPLDEIRTLLSDYGLEWDADRLDVRAKS